MKTVPTLIEIGSLLCALGILCVAAARYCRKPSAEHIHKPVPISPQEIQFHGDLQAAVPQTVLLLYCDCGIHVTRTYLGKWTIADFIRTESEIVELEKLAK